MSKNTKQFIEQQAFQVREEYGFTTYEIDLHQLGDEVGIEIQTQKVDQHGISGALIRSGNNFLIYYSSFINNVPYQRFSIAHEFGHYFLPEHPENIFDNNGWHISSANTNSKNSYEKEADYFSTCLLMPKKLFVDEIYKFNDGLEAIKGLASIFNTSLTTTAIRYIELTETPAMLVISSKGIIEAVFDTKELRKFGARRYTKNSIFPNKNIMSTEALKKEIFLHEWVDTNQKIKAIEETIALGGYDKVLTIITTSTLYEEIEDHEEDQWDPPLFKK
ncbi:MULTISPECIES: ImmA/IrrE family metallo-endopeptidase [Acinetobacter]|uniref:ImmA/IrrE family metallo-endopeptidase n=1 Tax=Acinetobacter TaxID=469 RepID=UPI000E5BA7CE|nr:MULTISPECIES: ImmA/IrrE family metallo-endopeptidase [Acinetobacter]MDA3493455.1 ImmA/IrrE family metallo-endopeptidase [Acinetobacter sp. AOR33_HL]MDH0180157.1 ImmA/IrrE family metallo-endopeptidase [Acinetobacter pittii]RTA16843.1 ImmA/IrrE family metallo-endopeptidase [Acinetobacter pittii]RZH23760.1 ImmA/IrrE family metallo-endopeptidase [Acinetobacter pittii]